LLKNYYTLTKPGIIRGNAIAAGAGFFLASQGHISLSLFAAMLVGLSLVIASGCICNNYIDRDIDQKMARTRNRALVTGTIGVRNALLFAAICVGLGTIILVVRTNLLTAGLAVFGWIAYVIIYGIAKRRSVHGTVIGSISGAIPPVVGYCAVSGRLDLGALLLFIIMVSWQMPHFYAIAIYRRRDYAAADIPVLPLHSGVRAAKVQILIYILAFIGASAALTVFGYTGYIYLVASLLIGGYWLWHGLQGAKVADETTDDRWARKMFGISLLVVLVWAAAIAVDSFVH
jgi:protoheme IX farnesyltransferase